MKLETPSRVSFSEVGGNSTWQLELFALLNLGLIESLTSGTLRVNEAIDRFYHADNCLHVRRRLRSREANEIMSRGVQLPDLFDSLPPHEAQRELWHELEAMRGLCRKLLEKHRTLQPGQRATA